MVIHPLFISLKQKISRDFMCGIRDMLSYLYTQTISGHTAHYHRYLDTSKQIVASHTSVLNIVIKLLTLIFTVLTNVLMLHKRNLFLPNFCLAYELACRSNILHIFLTALYLIYEI